MGQNSASFAADWRNRLGVELASRGVKLTKLSTDLGKHRDYVANIVSGKAQPDLETLMSVFAAAGINPMSVLTDSSEETVDMTVLEGTPLVDRLADAVDSINSAQLPWTPDDLDGDE